MAVSVSLAFPKSWRFFCIPADRVSSVEVGPGSPLKPSDSPDDSGLILLHGSAWLLSCYIRKWWQSGAMEKDSSAQTSRSRLKMTRPWKRSPARLCVQCLQRGCLSCLKEGAQIKSVPLNQSRAVTFWMWTCFRDLPENKNSSLWFGFQMPRPLR